jgi:hypothetical protein
MKDIILKSGTYSQFGKGLSLSAIFNRSLSATGIVRETSTSSAPCCKFQIIFPQLDATAYTAWTAEFTADTTNRQGEVIFNTATQKLVVATWNGTAWSFTAIH